METIIGIGQFGIAGGSSLLILALVRRWPMDLLSRIGTVLFIGIYFSRLGMANVLREGAAEHTTVYTFIANDWTIATNTLVIAFFMFAAFIPGIPCVLKIEDRV